MFVIYFNFHTKLLHYWQMKVSSIYNATKYTVHRSDYFTVWILVLVLIFIFGIPIYR